MMNGKIKQKKEDRLKSMPVSRQQPKNGGRQDYRATFLKSSSLKSRQCVYISKEAHGIVSKIVNTIADNEITVGGYIDTVLMHHFKENKEEINKMYRQERKELIGDM